MDWNAYMEELDKLCQGFNTYMQKDIDAAANKILLLEKKLEERSAELAELNKKLEERNADLAEQQKAREEMISGLQGSGSWLRVKRMGELDGKPELWNFKERRKARLDEGVQFLLNQVKTRRRKARRLWR